MSYKKKHKTINEPAWSLSIFNHLSEPDIFHKLAPANKLLHTSIKM
jgi:hypothetical protein